jgi:hypothetical protein
MNPDLKLRFDQMRQGDPSKPETPSGGSGDNAESHLAGYARNLCLVWPDGRRYFLNYAYLIGGEFLVGEEMNQIRLNFSSYTAILKGYGLQSLYMELLDHLPKVISATDPRYAQNKNSKDTLVVSIVVEINMP